MFHLQPQQKKNRPKKAGKEKPSAVVDALSTEEMSKDQVGSAGYSVIIEKMSEFNNLNQINLHEIIN